MKLRFALPALAALLSGTGCESQLAPPSEFSTQARNALEVLPPEARVVGMINVAEARQNPTYGYLVKQGFSPEQASSEGAARYRDFLQLTGFSPEEDLDRMYLAVEETDAGSSASFVAYGRFDPVRLQEYLGRNAGGEFSHRLVRDTPVYCADGSRARGTCFALVNDEMMAAASNSRAIEAMLERLHQGGPALDQNPEMMGLMHRVSHPESAWFIVRQPLVGAEDAPHPDGAGAVGVHQVGRMMQDLVVSFGFEDEGVQMNTVGLTRSAGEAEQAADLVKGIVAAMKGAHKTDEQVVKMLDDIRVRDLDGAVEVKLFLDEPTLRTLTGRRKAE